MRCVVNQFQIGWVQASNFALLHFEQMSLGNKSRGIPEYM